MAAEPLLYTYEFDSLFYLAQYLITVLPSLNSVIEFLLLK